jgi:hypothetical protein
MNLNNKLKGIPHIYYFNLDNRTDRREWMENQFKNWNIQNYTRISGSKYLGSKYQDWKHLVTTRFEIDLDNSPFIANAITHIEFLDWWIKNTKDEYLILMEDDYDLDPIKFWHFDWEYLMNNIPYDWDCIQLSYTSKIEVKFFLSPKQSHGTFFGPCMLNRRYVEKLISLHLQNKKFTLNYRTNDWMFRDIDLSVDYCICSPGRTYCLPLLSMNNSLTSYENRVYNRVEWHNRCVKLLYYWWENKRDEFPLEDFFTYGKPHDHLMTMRVY